ncbi:MAG: Hsp20/alpha crystallin family protein [Treponema sp.]
MNTLRIFNPAFTDSLFEALGTTFYGADNACTRDINPATDVRQTTDAYQIDMNLPGYTEDEIRIQVKDRVLSIASNHSKEESSDSTTAAENAESSAEQFLLRERIRGEFVRRFTLPEDSNTENIEAGFKNGVLTITVPRKAALPHRDIMIKAS